MENFLALSTEYVEMGQNNEAILYGNKCINMAKELDDKQAERRAFLVVGKARCGLKQYDEAIEHARMCLHTTDETDSPNDRVEAYDLLGEAHALKGQYDDAITYYEVGLARAKSAGNVRKSAEMSFKVGMICYSLGSYEDAIRQCKESVDLAKTKRDINTMMQAFYIIGRTYYESNNYDETISYCIKCLGVSDSGNKNIRAAACLLIGCAYFEQGKYDDALIYSNKCMNFAKETDDAMTFTQTASLLLVAKTFPELDNALTEDYNIKRYEEMAYYLRGIAHQSLGQYDDALCNYKKGIVIAKNAGYVDIEALLYFFVGSTHQLQNQYDDAVKYFEKSIALTKKTSNKIREMNSYLKLAETYILLSQEKQALLPAKKALGIAKEVGDKNAKTSALLHLIGLHRSLGQQQDFAHCVDQLNPIDNDLFTLCFGGTKRPTNPLHICKLLDSYDKFLQQPGELEIDIISAFDNVTAPFVLDNLQEYFMMLTKLDPDNLEVLYDTAIKCMNIHYNMDFLSAPIFSKVENLAKNLSFQQKILPPGGVDYPKEIRTKQNATQPLGQWKIVMSWLLAVFEMALKWFSSFNAVDHMGRFYTCIGTIQYLLKQNANAKASLTEAIGCFESVLDPLHDESKITIVDRYIDTYKLLSEILIKEGKKEEAFLVSERCRAQVLKTILFLKYGMKQDVSQSHIQLDEIYSLVSKKSSILFYSVGLNDLLAFLVEEGNIQHFSVESIEAQGLQMYSLERYISDTFTEIGVPNDTGEHKHILSDPQMTWLTKLLKNASPQEVKEMTEICFEGLKLFPASDNASDSKLNPDDTTSVTDWTAVLGDERIEKLKEMFELFQEESNPSDTTGSQTSAWEALSDKLLNKISIKQEEIVIIPDGPLFRVPFAALRNPSTGNYLSEDKKIRLAPSLTTLKLLSECPADFHLLTGALVIGDPQVGKVMQDGVEQDIPSLEGALVEAVVIASKFSVDPLTGPQATKPIVIEKLKQGASVVHIAAHGSLSKATILLAPTPEIRQEKTLPDEEDYMLTMADVQQAHVRAQLVVLSCCYSGRGEIRAEGVVGMCRAFLASGVRAVVASLWAVDDDATLEFMSYFYLYLQEGQSASTSLQMAMNVVRQNAQYSEPKYWAPFFLMGDDVTINF